MGAEQAWQLLDDPLDCAGGPIPDRLIGDDADAVSTNPDFSDAGEIRKRSAFESSHKLVHLAGRDRLEMGSAEPMEVEDVRFRSAPWGPFG